MLGFLFGFDARLGRLHYFLSTIGLAIVTTGLCFAFASSIYQSTARVMPLSFGKMPWPVIAIAAFFLLSSFSLQCMRIRDIGWDPVCVVPTWIAIIIIDRLIASKIPAWAIDPEHHGTAVGALINFGMLLALTFWPGSDRVASPPSFEPPPRQPDPPSRRGGETAAAARIARASSGTFGQR